jgi:hypothetical protein
MASRARRPALDTTITAIVRSLPGGKEPDSIMAHVGKIMKTYLLIRT